MDFIFATAFLETSGMKDKNELTPISTKYTNNGEVNRDLPNNMPDIFLLEVNNYYVTNPFRKVQSVLQLEWSEIKNRLFCPQHLYLL